MDAAERHDALLLLAYIGRAQVRGLSFLFFGPFRATVFSLSVSPYKSANLPFEQSEAVRAFFIQDLTTRRPPQKGVLYGTRVHVLSSGSLIIILGSQVLYHNHVLIMPLYMDYRYRSIV